MTCLTWPAGPPSWHAPDPAAACCFAKPAGAPAETPAAAIAQAAPRMRAARLLRFMNSSSSGGWDDERGDRACWKLVGERQGAHLDVEFLGTRPPVVVH